MVKQVLRTIITLMKKSIASLTWSIRLVSNSDLKNHIPKQVSGQLLTILANGPSLKDNLNQIDYTQGEFLVVNDFYKSPYYKKIKPQYHVLMDPLYFRNNEDIKPFAEAVDWDMKLFVPYTAWKGVDILRNMPNKHIEVIPCILVSYNGFECFRNWIYQHGLAMPKAQNVLVASIFAGINMGYKKIRLYGVDHSWTESIRVNNKNEVCLTDSHFYDKEEVQLLPWKKWTGEPYKIYEVLRDLANTFDSYHRIERYARHVGCHVVNMTHGSYIDAFERA